MIEPGYAVRCGSLANNGWILKEGEALLKRTHCLQCISALLLAIARKS